MSGWPDIHTTANAINTMNLEDSRSLHTGIEEDNWGSDVDSGQNSNSYWSIDPPQPSRGGRGGLIHSNAEGRREGRGRGRGRGISMLEQAEDFGQNSYSTKVQDDANADLWNPLPPMAGEDSNKFSSDPDFQEDMATEGSGFGFRGRGRGRGRGGGERGRGRGGERGRGRGRGGSGNSSSECYKCHQTGHFARECPSDGDSAQISNTGCYNCKEEGHVSRDCPRGLLCRNCQQSGHMAKDCSQPRQKPSTEKAEEKPPPSTYEPIYLEEEELFNQGISAGSNFSSFDNVAVKVSGKGDIPGAISNFKESGLRTLLLENILTSNYQKPTPIQKHAIPIIMRGRDLMGCAQTGSGKTAAFLLPILHHILENNLDSGAFEDPVKPVALVLSPTRELCIQIFNEARKFSLKSIVKVCIVYGGTAVLYQLKSIQKGCHILVATPGRLLDFVERSRVVFDNLKFLILDEADRMLDMGFKSAIDKIVGHPSTPDKESRQTLLFSATFAEEIQELAKRYLNDYVFVVTGRIGAANIDVKQSVLNVDKWSKRETLLSYIKEEIERSDEAKILVFVETKRMADFIAIYLSDQGVSSTSIHGDRYQNQRETALAEFKAGIRHVLVATAVAARGLDIRGVGTVVNFDMPKEIDEYVHRIGRTGRVGNPGKAVSYFDTEQDASIAKSLVKLLGDAEQEVPDWLIQCAHTSGGVLNYQRRDFGAKDIRNKGIRTKEYPAPTANPVNDWGGPAPVNNGCPIDEESWD